MEQSDEEMSRCGLVSAIYSGSKYLFDYVEEILRLALDGFGREEFGDALRTEASAESRRSVHAPCTNMAEYWQDIQGDIVPRCTACRGVLRPDVVFFGEGLPAEFSDHQASDFEACDLLIVMGTSLKVYPFAGLTNQVTPLTPRLLFNAEPVGAFVHGAQWQLPDTSPEQTSSLQRITHKDEYTNSYRDVSVIGDIDQGIMELAKALKWDAELSAMIETYKPSNSF